MVKKNITKNDMEYMDSTLYCYYYLRRMEQKYIQESLDIELQIKNEGYGVKGMSYDSVSGNGCSVHFPTGDGMNPMVKLQTEFINKARVYKERYTSLDKQNMLMETFSKISVESQIMINYVYQRELNINDIVKIISEDKGKSITVQAVRKKIDKALNEMVGAIK